MFAGQRRPSLSDWRTCDTDKCGVNSANPASQFNNSCRVALRGRCTILLPICSVSWMSASLANKIPESPPLPETGQGNDPICHSQEWQGYWNEIVRKLG